jgi:hypothetical protein
MKRFFNLLATPLALVSAGTLGGCVTDGYGHGGYSVGIGYADAYPYDGYYDGFYGSVYDGYWGNDGYFYYRGNANDRRFRRGDHAHFGRQPGNGGHWQPMRGNFQPSHGMRMPSFPRGGAPGGGVRGGGAPGGGGPGGGGHHGH